MLLRLIDKPMIEKVVSEITGRPEALRRTHWNGRVDIKLRPEKVTVGVEDIPRITGLALNDLRWLIYEHHREAGMSHEEVIAKCFRDGKVSA